MAIVLTLTALGCTNVLRNCCEENTAILEHQSNANTDIYVSPNGSDANPGTSSSPLLTLICAVKKVKAINGQMATDITVWLRGGIYYLSAPLAINQSLSGTGGKVVAFSAYPGEHPLISGGRCITGWTIHDAAKNIWQASAQGLLTRQLFVNGVRAVRAASTNGLSGMVTKTATGYETTDLSMQSWRNPADIEFVYNAYKGGTGGSTWTERRVAVAKISGTSTLTMITMKQPAYSLAGKGKTQAITNPTGIENAYELLDQPGEWYLDKVAGVVYYIPRPGEDMKTALVIVPVLEKLLDAVGTLNSPVHHLQFKRISFAHTTWLRPGGDQGFPEVQANFMADGERIPGALSFRHSHDITIQDCSFVHLGGVGLDVFDGCQRFTVVGNLFDDISGTGIQIGSANDPHRSDIRLRESAFTIRNNLLHKTTCEYHGGCAITVVYGADMDISHNEIAHCSYTGISVGWGWGSNAVSFACSNRINFNNIHHYAEVLTDQGGIYTLGSQPGSEIAGNYIHDQGLFNWEHGGAIYPDDGSRHFDIHHNVLDKTGAWIFMWCPTVRDLNVHDNFSNTPRMLNVGSNITLANNDSSITVSNWPPIARKIISRAGLEPACATVKKLYEDGAAKTP